MSYKVTINNKTLELPKCTLAIEEMVEKIRDTEKEVGKGTARKRTLVEQMLEFVCMCIGEEQAKDVLNYTDIEDIDTKDLEIAVNRILNSYSTKLTNEQITITRKTITDIDKTLKADNILSIANLSANK